MSQPIKSTLGLERRDLCLIVGLFAVSRLLYGLLGLHFDATPLQRYMQFIDPQLLSSRLLESLWHYHANPPMLNLLAGVGLKWFGEQADWFFATVFHAMGLLLAISVYALTLRLSMARAAAIAATGLLVFSPSFVLYENWLMYTFPAVVLLTVSALALYLYVKTRKTAWCVTFFLVLAALLLTRSLFHLAWMLLIVVLLVVVLRDRRRLLLLAAIGPVLLVTVWYGKNYYYFGVFSGSTWMGLGLSNISTLVVTREELEPLVEEGRLSRFALISRYRQKEALFAAQQLPPTGIPVLDQVRKSNGEYNFNNRQLIEVSRCYARDAATVIRTYPFSYLVGLIISNRLFFSPSSMNLYFSKENRAAAKPMEQLFNPLLLGVRAEPRYLRQPHYGFAHSGVLEVNTSVPLMLAWVLVLGYGYAQARRGIMSGQLDQQPRAIVIGFILITTLYVYVVGTTLELAENYRYRFLIEPLFLVLAATALTSLVRKVRGVLSGRRIGTGVASDT